MNKPSFCGMLMEISFYGQVVSLKYRDFAKDYEINYVAVPGKSRLRAVRVYKGPFFRFAVSPQRIRFLRWYYTVGLGAVAILLLIPMCMDCTLTRVWYIQVPAAAAWIPWVLAMGSLWRLWTAKERVDREHCEFLYNRMSSSTLFLILFCGISFVGCVIKLTSVAFSVQDWITMGCCAGSFSASAALFLGRKDLKMIPAEG